MSRQFYAIAWTYGVASDSNGNRCCDVLVFESKVSRDEWVNQGPPFRSDPGYRECIRRADMTRKELERSVPLPSA